MKTRVEAMAINPGIWNIRLSVGCLIVLWICMIWMTPALAAYQELDGIVAVVEDDVVLVSELMLRIDAVRKQIDANGSAMPPEEILISQVLERLIQENIQYQEASKRGIDIDEDTLTKAVTQFATTTT